MKINFPRVLLLSLAFFFISNSNASLIYQESLHGDIPAPGNTYNIELSEGLNIISGQSSFVTDEEYPYSNFFVDHDFFSFYIPEKHVGVSIRYIYNTIASDASLIAIDVVDIFNFYQYESKLVSESFSLFNVDTYLYNSTLSPLISGSYSTIFSKGEVGGIPGAWNINTNWQFEILVKPVTVPEPNTFLLFLSMLLVILIRRDFLSL